MNNIQSVADESPSDLPLVSVGIPTFNRPEGVRRTLECITGQTYNNLEIIVSDNCSPGPETEGVVREFMKNDSRIQYYRQEINKGPSFNFEFVLGKANGEYFMWAADDDAWEKDHITTLVNNIICDNAALAISRWYHIYPNSERFNRKWPSLSIIGETNYHSFINFLKTPHWDIDKACFIYGLIRTEILKDTQIQNSIHQGIGSDIIILLELLCHGNFSYTEKITWSYRYGFPTHISLFKTIKSKIYKISVVLGYCLGYTNKNIKECEKFYFYIQKLIIIHFNGSKYARFLNYLYKYKIIFLTS